MTRMTARPSPAPESADHSRLTQRRGDPPEAPTPTTAQSTQSDVVNRAASIADRRLVERFDRFLRDSHPDVEPKTIAGYRRALVLGDDRAQKGQHRGGMRCATEFCAGESVEMDTLIDALRRVKRPTWARQPRRFNPRRATEAVAPSCTVTASGQGLACEIAAGLLRDAVGLACRAIGPRPPYPVLSNVLLSWGSDGLSLAATDLHLTIECRVPAGDCSTSSGALEQRITVPGRLLLEMLTPMPRQDSLTLTVAGPTLHIVRSTGAPRNLNGIEAVEFPPLPARPAPKEASGVVRMEVDDLATAIDQVVVAASTDDARPVLMGVLLEFGHDDLTLVATDGHRVRVASVSASGLAIGSHPVSVIVPALYMAEVRRAITARSGSVEMLLPPERSHIFFCLKDVTISSRLIEGVYPNYRQVIPEASSTEVTLPTSELLAAVRMCLPLVKDAANVLRLSIREREGSRENELVVAAATAEVGDGEEQVRIDSLSGNPDLEIACNGRYLCDAIRKVQSASLTLCFNGRLAPFAVRAADPPGDPHVIMPVKLPDAARDEELDRQKAAQERHEAATRAHRGAGRVGCGRGRSGP